MSLATCRPKHSTGSTIVPSARPISSNRPYIRQISSSFSSGPRYGGPSLSHTRASRGRKSSARGVGVQLRAVQVGLQSSGIPGTRVHYALEGGSPSHISFGGLSYSGILRRRGCVGGKRKRREQDAGLSSGSGCASWKRQARQDCGCGGWSVGGRSRRPRRSLPVSLDRRLTRSDHRTQLLPHIHSRNILKVCVRARRNMCYSAWQTPPTSAQAQASSRSRPSNSRGTTSLRRMTEPRRSSYKQAAPRNSLQHGALG